MKIIRLAIRSLVHFRLYSLINILGLALSLMCVTVIARYLYSELTVDHFHQNRERIFVSMVEHQQGGRKQFTGFWNNYFTTDFRQDPAIEKQAEFFIMNEEQRVEVGEKNYPVKLLLADSGFLQLLNFPVLHGEGNLYRPESAIITESLASRLFGKEDPIGKTFQHSMGNTYTIVGVLDRFPGKSVFDFDVIVPMKSIERFSTLTGIFLIQLHPGQDYRNFNEKYSEFKGDKNSGLGVRYVFMPLNDIYYNDFHTDSFFLSGNRKSVSILALVGLMILLVGVINFMNIYTAVVLRRGREFGMKKVFGADGKSLFGQLWVENVVMIAFSLIIALSLTELLSPVIRNVLRFEQFPYRLFDLWIALGVLLIIPMITSLFPYLNYAYRTVASSLRSVGKTGGRSLLRPFFLGLQYAATFIMIIVSLFFVKQLRFMLNKDLGFRTEDVIQVQLYSPYKHFLGLGDRDEMKKLQTTDTEKFTRKVDESPYFIRWTLGNNPMKPHASDPKIRISGQEPLGKVAALRTDKKWMEIFELRVLAGTLWEKDEDETGYFYFGKEGQNMNTNLIFTESALKAFGLDLSNYQDAVFENDQYVTSIIMKEKMADGGISIESIFGDLQIQAVVQDVFTDHLSTSHPPLIFIQQATPNSPQLIASIAPGKRKEAVESLCQWHADIFGGDFEYTFLEDEVEEMYREDRKIATVYTIFTVIAIFVSGLGLFSMSLYDIQQRRREIAIRKVNGATTPVIIRLLLRRYLVVLAGSFVIAVPIAVLFVLRYLQGFAYKTSFSWWIFLLAFVVTAGISLLTLIWQITKAANANPAEVIRNE